MTREPGRADLTIVHVSDTHLEPRRTEQYAGVNDRLGRIREEIRALRADLVVATGDLTNRGSADPGDFALALEWLTGLDTPYLAVPGNHDLGANPLRGEMFPHYERYEPVPFHETGYARAFGTDLVPGVTVGPVTVLGVVLREDDPDGALPQLAEQLRQVEGMVLVAGHYPVIEPRPIPSLEHFGARGYVDRSAERLREVLAASENVVGYLCGHVHLTSMHPISPRCTQFTAGGLGPGAASYRSYRIQGDTLRYGTHEAEGPQVFWEGGSAQARAIPHFSSGTAEERCGVLPLPGHRGR
ncbi:metallophosphoesterase family protein [Micromonospora echinospora]|uniref:metallophosphoesterase family protein n=1 Tax=Micromonospora echinospora TaxID=1877 RepID=UPI0037A2404E